MFIREYTHKKHAHIVLLTIVCLGHYPTPSIIITDRTELDKRYLSILVINCYNGVIVLNSKTIYFLRDFHRRVKYEMLQNVSEFDEQFCE